MTHKKKEMDGENTPPIFLLHIGGIGCFMD